MIFLLGLMCFGIVFLLFVGAAAFAIKALLK